MPTIAKIVKNTNLRYIIYKDYFFFALARENKVREPSLYYVQSPHDHDLFERGACQEVPESLQSGACKHLGHLGQLNYSELLQDEIDWIGCFRKAHRLKDSKEESGGDHSGGKFPNKREGRANRGDQDCLDVGSL